MAENGNEKKGMNNAYRIAGELLKDRLKDVEVPFLGSRISRRLTLSSSEASMTTSNRSCHSPGRPSL
jgi:hypothetical protein